MLKVKVRTLKARRNDYLSDFVVVFKDDDDRSKTEILPHEFNKELAASLKYGGNRDAAAAVGKAIGERAKSAGIDAKDSSERTICGAAPFPISNAARSRVTFGNAAAGHQMPDCQDPGGPH